MALLQRLTEPDSARETPDAAATESKAGTPKAPVEIDGGLRVRRAGRYLLVSEST